MAYKGNKLQLGGWVGGAHLRNVFWERLNAEHGLVQCCSLDFTTKKMETFYGIFHANFCFSMCSFTLVKLYQEFRIWYNFDTLGHAHRFHYIRSVHKSSFWEISNMPVWVPLLQPFQDWPCISNILSNSKTFWNNFLNWTVRILAKFSVLSYFWKRYRWDTLVVMLSKWPKFTNNISIKIQSLKRIQEPAFTNVH